MCACVCACVCVLPQVEAVGYSKMVAVSGKVVPLVHIDSSALVGHNLQYIPTTNSTTLNLLFHAIYVPHRESSSTLAFLYMAMGSLRENCVVYYTVHMIS